MTRRDYVMLSTALGRGRMYAHQLVSADFEAGRKMGYNQAVCSVADALKRSNVSFDAQRFLRDSGVE